MKRYDSYKDSGVEWIGEIPSGWEKRKFKWDIFYQEGPGLRTFQFTDSGVRVICVSNITEHGIDFETTHTRHISQDEYEEKYKHFTVNDRDILLSSSGSIGKVSRYFFDGKPVILNTSTIRIHSSNKENYLDDFVPYVLSSNYIQIQLRFLMTGGIVSNFGPSHLDQLFNYIPPLLEQQQIVSFLDSKTSQIDELIQKKERKIELLKKYRTSLINQVVTKGLNPNVEMKDSGVEWIGEIPSHWFCVGTNKVYNDLGTGTTPTSDNSDYYSDNGYHWITTTDLNEGIMLDTLSKITEKSVKDYPNLRLYPSGSIYISMYGGRIGKLGVSTFDSYCNQSVCVLPKNDTIIVKFYYYWFLGFQEFVKGMGRGGGQPNINKDMIKSFPTVKIPLFEQQQIVLYLDEQTHKIDSSIQSEEKKIELLKEYRQSLISEVVTGKIDVRLN